jgi:hypothetical protein
MAIQGLQCTHAPACEPDDADAPQIGSSIVQLRSQHRTPQAAK